MRDAIASTLRLDDDAVAHLHRLAQPAPSKGRRRPRPAERVSLVVRRMVDAWADQAAFVIGRHRDVLAANALAVALNPGFAPGRNLVRDVFLDEATRELYLDWRDVALGLVTGLRESVGIDQDDPARRARRGAERQER